MERLSPNLRGALFMMLSMAGFAIEDLLVKLIARDLPLGQIMLTTGLMGAAIFTAMSLSRREAPIPRAALVPALAVRSAFEITGRLFYGLALALTPLSLTSAILQATPLVVLAGAALFLGEKVGWRRWSAVAVGFLGVMIVLRPGLSGFSALSLLAVLGMLGFAGRDIATRIAPKVLTNRQLGTIGFLMLAIAGGILLSISGGWVMPNLQAILGLGATSFFAVGGYHALTSAMRTGDVAAVTPFRYIRLVFAVILAVMFLGERPDALTLVGSGLIVVSGLYTLSRARRVAGDR